VPLPDDAQPGDVFFSPDGSKLVGTRVNTSLIDSFVVGGDGRLTAAPGSPFAAEGIGPFGSEFRPTSSGQLFVSNAHNGGLAGTVSAFADASDGTLTSIGASPYADLQAAPCWVEISHDGRYLFAVNTASTSVSRFEIADDGSLTLLGSTTFATTAGIGATDARLSVDGATLYVLESAAHALAVFSVDGGDLTEQPGLAAALPPGAAPSGIAVV
jgi:DNA-binding beta-propeller fold protein YncE